MQQTILVTGGAGYIGSVIVHELVRAGYSVIVVDEKPRHHAFAQTALVHHIVCDYGDTRALEGHLAGSPIDAVIHCAALIEVAESVAQPARYYDVNIVRLIHFLDWMRQRGIRYISASSSSAVYGTVHAGPLHEELVCHPVSPYGRTKLMLEMILHDYAAAYGIVYSCARYFNAAGALPEEGLGEQHEPETHLIPRIFLALQTGKPLVVSGNDYPTLDGSCIRDYVHVRDIAQAHIVLLRYMMTTESSLIVNVGSGLGTSVWKLIAAVEAVTGQRVPVSTGSRRPGDPAELCADTTRLRALGWAPEFSDLPEIIGSAYRFACRGYREGYPRAREFRPEF